MSRKKKCWVGVERPRAPFGEIAQSTAAICPQPVKLVILDTPPCDPAGAQETRPVRQRPARALLKTSSSQFEPFKHTHTHRKKMISLLLPLPLFVCPFLSSARPLLRKSVAADFSTTDGIGFRPGAPPRLRFPTRGPPAHHSGTDFFLFLFFLARNGFDTRARPSLRPSKLKRCA